MALDWLSHDCEHAVWIECLYSTVNCVLLSRKTGWSLDSHEVGIDTWVLDDDNVSDCIRLSVTIVVSSCVCRRDGDFCT